MDLTAIAMFAYSAAYFNRGANVGLEMMPVFSCVCLVLGKKLDSSSILRLNLNPFLIRRGSRG